MSNLVCGFVDPPKRFFCYTNDSFEYPIQEGKCNISIELVTNLDFPQTGSKINIYPNPSTDNLTIKNDDLAEEWLLRITSISGKILKEVKIIDDQPLNISNLTPGLDFLAIFSESQLLERKRIVKQ